jgi:hypothetical protein
MPTLCWIKEQVIFASTLRSSKTVSQPPSYYKRARAQLEALFKGNKNSQ